MAKRTTTKAYIGDYAVISKGEKNPGLRYLHKDRLGSVETITDGDNQIATIGDINRDGQTNALDLIVEQRVYDVFGEARPKADTNPNNDQWNVNGVTSSGYTGHEHLQSVHIHMNGRAYDPKTGRFLSVDPFIAFPENGQSINPYSYVMNNPLGYTDPSGYMSKAEFVKKREGHRNNIKVAHHATVTETDSKGNTKVTVYIVIVVKSGGHSSQNHQSASIEGTQNTNSNTAESETSSGDWSTCCSTQRSQQTDPKRYIVNQNDIDGTTQQLKIGEIEGYDESGSNSWRAANDAIFIEAVTAYNAMFNLSPGDDGYWTPLRLKAQAMVESGGDKDAFLSDPLQVNNSGDWDPKKATLLGLKKYQTMTPKISAKAALRWLRYKGHIHNAQGQIVRYRGDFEALR